MSATDAASAVAALPDPTPVTVNDQTHRIVCALGQLSDTTSGLAELIEGLVPEDGGTLWRAVIRLAEAIAADVADVHLKLDHLWLAMPHGIEAKSITPRD